MTKNAKLHLPVQPSALATKVAPQQHANASIERAQRCTRAYVELMERHCEYAVTLQTRLLTFGKSHAQCEPLIERVERGFNYFLPRLNKYLTGNGWKRCDSYCPIFIPVIEGQNNFTNTSMSLHIHALLGNVNRTKTYDDVLLSIKRAWAEVEISSDDIKLESLNNSESMSWAKYITKGINGGNNGLLCWHGVQAPMPLRNAIKIELS